MCARACGCVCFSFLCLFDEFRNLFLLICAYRHQSSGVDVRYAMHVSFWIRVHVFQLLYACVARAGTCVRTRTFALIVQKSAMEPKTAQTAMTKHTAVSFFCWLVRCLYAIFDTGKLYFMRSVEAAFVGLPFMSGL